MERQPSPEQQPFLEAVFPYTISTAPTNRSGRVTRRVIALGICSGLLWLVHPIPKLSSLTSLAAEHEYLPLALKALDAIVSTVLIVPTLFFTYHLSCEEEPVMISGKPFPVKWLIPGASVVIALAAAAEDSWIKTNVLWDILAAFWVCGWNVMSPAQRWFMQKSALIACVGSLVEEMRRASGNGRGTV